jgi:hypothetical protein
MSTLCNLTSSGEHVNGRLNGPEGLRFQEVGSDAETESQNGVHYDEDERLPAAVDPSYFTINFLIYFGPIWFLFRQRTAHFSASEHQTAPLTRNRKEVYPQAPETAFLTSLVMESDFNPESSAMD